MNNGIYYYVIYFIVQIIAARLDEMISDDKKQLPHVLSCIADEASQRELQTIDEEEDFLDESKDNCIINSPKTHFKTYYLCISIWNFSDVQLSDGLTVDCMYAIFGNNVLSTRDL